MTDDARIGVVTTLLAEHTKSRSLRHIRDPYALAKLATQIVRTLDRGNPLWRKWTGPREELLAAAARCWIPVADLKDFLNGIEGQQLTTTDVTERLEAIHLEPHNRYPNDELRAGCLAIYENEKSAGTEMRAIIGALQRFCEEEEERLRLKRENEWREHSRAEREALEGRFMSGADCKWTPLQGSKQIYCRINGRAYRLDPTKDKRWDLHRIISADDSQANIVGTYRSRGEATKALRNIAFQPEPRW